MSRRPDLPRPVRGRPRPAGAPGGRSSRSTSPAYVVARCWRCSRSRRPRRSARTGSSTCLWPEEPPGERRPGALQPRVPAARAPRARSRPPGAARRAATACAWSPTSWTSTPPGGWPAPRSPAERLRRRRGAGRERARRSGVAPRSRSSGAARAGGRVGRARRAAPAAASTTWSRPGCRSATAGRRRCAAAAAALRRCASARRSCTCGRWPPTAAPPRRWRRPRRSGGGWPTRPASTRGPRWPSSSRRSPPARRGSAPAPPARSRRVVRPDGPLVGREHDREEIAAPARHQRDRHPHRPRRRREDPARARRRRRPRGRRTPTVVVVDLAAVDRPGRVCQAVASTLGLRTTGEVSAADVADALAGRRPAARPRQLRAPARRLPRPRRHRSGSAAPAVRVLATSRVDPARAGGVRRPPAAAARAAGPLRPRRPAAAAGRPGVRRARPAPAGRLRAAAERRRRPRGGAAPAGRAAARHRAGRPPGGRDAAARRARAARPRPRPRHRPARRRRRPAAHAPGDHRLVVPAARRGRAVPAAGDGAVPGRRRPRPRSRCWRRRRAAGDPLDLLHRLVDASLVFADARRAVPAAVHRAGVPRRRRCAGRASSPQPRTLPRPVPRAGQDVGERLFGPDEPAADRLLRDELDNLRAARDVALAHGRDDVRVGITIALDEAVAWRDLRELWAWALELAADPRLADHPERAAMLGCAAEAARLIGDLDLASRLADEAFAVAGPDPDPSQVHRAWTARGSVAHFRGDFAAGQRGVAALQRQPAIAVRLPTRLGRPGRGVRRRPGGRPRPAGPRPRRDRTVAVRLAPRLRRVRRGRAAGDGRGSRRSVPFYLEAIEGARRAGATFVEGVASVALASARTRIGDVAGAADGFAYLIDYWRRTGQTTQLWTTARNAAGLLSTVGRTRTAALLLISADDAAGGRRRRAGDRPLQRARVHAGDRPRVPRSRLAELRAEAVRSGAGGGARPRRQPSCGSSPRSGRPTHRQVRPRPRDSRARRGSAAPGRSPAVPAAATRAGTSRVRWHPPATRVWIGSSRRCQRRTRSVGPLPCSRKWKVPPGRSTRRTSRSASSTSGIVHSVNVRQDAVVRRVVGVEGLPVQPDPVHGRAAALAPLAPTAASRRRTARPRRPTPPPRGRSECSGRCRSRARGPARQPGARPLPAAPRSPGCAASRRRGAAPRASPRLAGTCASLRWSRARVRSGHERPAGDGHRDRVRHLGAGAAPGQPDGGLVAGGQRLRLGDRAGAPGPLGLRGGVAAARRARLRHVAPGRRPEPAHRRGHGPGQRDPHQRRPAVRRPRPPRVLHARGHHAARHRALGQGGRAGDARRRAARRASCPTARRSCSTRTTPTTRARRTAPTRTT